MTTLPPSPDGRGNTRDRGYVHAHVTIVEMRSYLLSVFAILCAAVPGTLMAYWGISSLGLAGIPLALATVVAGMVLSVALFAGLIALGRALNFIK